MEQTGFRHSLSPDARSNVNPKFAVNTGSREMRVLHAALMLHPSSGIITQMRWEQLAAEHAKLGWTVRIFCPTDFAAAESLFQHAEGVHAKGNRTFLSRIVNYVRFRRQYYAWLARFARDCDFLLLRYSTSDPFQFFFLLTAKVPVYLVHHTLEVQELAAIGGASAWSRRILECVFGGLSHSKAAGVIGVTNEISERHAARIGMQSCFTYPNGIFKPSVGPRAACVEKPSVPDSRGPQLIFVASYFSPWHGLDLLLDNIQTSKREFTLHLVGEMNADDLRRARSDRRIVVYGALPQQQLSTLFAEVDVGLSSFALSRKGMTEACPLKTREYLGAGIPVYAGHPDVFDESCGFYRVGPPTIDGILEFATRVAETPRDIVADKSAGHIDKERLLLRLYSWLKGKAPSNE
jgi:glycosyltransferase involved in cell wall biosynthesis